MEGNGDLAAGAVNPISDFGVFLVDGETGGEEDGEGEDEAWIGRLLSRMMEGWRCIQIE